MTPDLTATLAQLRDAQAQSSALIEASFAAAADASNRHTFVRLFEASARQEAVHADARRRAGETLPLEGVAVSVKDLFDVAGHPTTAGSAVLAMTAPPASVDSPAVARLRAAGAAIVGHTNMTEFAFSGVGINPHHGTPVNPATLALDPRARIPGGSTSGGAVSVATGAAWAALGSDTGGSIRIPAALQGLVGFKNTQCLTPLDGAVPLSTTLDTACAITRSVRDAVLLHEVLAARRVGLAGKPVHALRLAIPTTTLLDGLEPPVARAFERSCAALARAGAALVERPARALEQLSALQAGGGFAAAEAWAWHRTLLSRHEQHYDPRVATRIRRGEAMTAADYIDLLQARRSWIAAMQAEFDGFDAALSPTVPIVAPPLQELVDSDDAFFAANAALLRNPSVVNLLDGCAISLPCHTPGEWPVGLMLWNTALRDDAVLDAAVQVEALLREATA